MNQIWWYILINIGYPSMMVKMIKLAPWPYSLCVTLFIYQQISPFFIENIFNWIFVEENIRSLSQSEFRFHFKSNRQEIRIDADYGLPLNRRHFIIWIIEDSFHWRIHTWIGRIELSQYVYYLCVKRGVNFYNFQWQLIEYSIWKSRVK